MSKRGSWFSGFLGPSTQASTVDVEADVKERAARLTREADIRRLYEAGTQKEVLEQLYKAEEVEACIQKYKEEKELLSLLDGSEKTEPAPENNDTNNEEQGGEPSSQNASEDENKEGLGHVNTTSKGQEETGTGKMHTNFTLRLDSSSGTQIDASITDVQRDRNLDRSLDETNLLEVGMDSVHINESSTRSHTRGTGQENSYVSAGDNDEQPEPEDDLLKELLNPDLDESSQYEDDSVTTHDDDFQGINPQTQNPGEQDKQSDAETNGTNNEQKVAIDTSAIMGQQGGSGNIGNSQQAQESVDTSEQGASLSSKEGGTIEVKDDQCNESATSEADSLRDEDKSENMNTEEPMVTTEELEAEETMDAESEEPSLSDYGEKGDTMDDQEENHMETTSVEDDEELSEEEIEEAKKPDEEMDEPIRPQSPDTMDAGKFHQDLTPLDCSWCVD